MGLLNNSWRGVGRTTKMPDLRYTPGGTAVCRFNMAVDTSYDSDKEEDITDFVPCKIWGKRAEAFAENVGKGSKIAVIGQLKVEWWEDDSGNDRRDIYVLIRDVDYSNLKDPSVDVGPQGRV